MEEKSCLTPSTTFPAQPPTAEVPETREAVSSKTSCLRRPKPRAARGQWPGQRTKPPTRSPHNPHPRTIAPLLSAQPAHAEASRFPEPGVSIGPLVLLVTWSLHSPMGCPPPLPFLLFPPSPPSTQPNALSSLTFHLVRP